MSAVYNVRRHRVGRPEYVAALHGAPLPAAARSFAERGDTVIALGDESGWLALFSLADQIRDEAAGLVAALHKAGRHVTLLTGDARPAAQRVAQALAIETVEAAMTPQAKHDFVRRIQAEGGVVAMVGDGVNDAPVLAQAQVSIAMGGGSQLARTQADLILLSENLDHLRRGYVVARRSLRVIRQNLVWSFIYNFVALPLAMIGLVTPWMAGIGMSGSSLLVVLNSLRLQTSSER